MNSIDKLVEKLCPDGVEYLKLGDITNFQNGFSFVDLQ